MSTPAPKPEMKGLSADFIATLMANTRTRNAYGPKLLEFVESDEAAINPRDVWFAEFGAKQSGTMYQGFMKAAKDAKLTDTIRISQVDGEVFILHTERVSLALAAATDTATE